MMAPLAVYLEVGPKRTFAGAVEWPGWCRSGRGEDEAREKLSGVVVQPAAVRGHRARPSRRPRPARAPLPGLVP